MKPLDETTQEGHAAAADALAKMGDLPAKQRARMITMPREGMGWNPLRDWPRNETCFCNSGLKAKKCCLNRQPDCIDEKDAHNLRVAMLQGEVGRAAIRAEYQRHKDTNPGAFGAQA